MKQTTVFAIGRWMPIHLGHKNFLVKLAKSYDRLVVGIGSCYENGTPRNCIPAIEREKLLRKIFKKEGISNYAIIPVEDRPTFEEWILDVCHVCERYEVTHFCTGNKEDILDVMQEKGIRLDVEMINPEDGSDFPYHATDIRNTILRGEHEKLDGMIPSEIKPMVLDQITREIVRASRGQGQEFVPGRQTVDLIFTVTDPVKKGTYVIIGKRNMEKIDFPGVWALPGSGIKEFESPIDAAARCFLAETGIEIAVTDNSEEPADIRIKTLGDMPAKLLFTGIYASHDERINGTRGGGSQCFALNIVGDTEKIAECFHPVKDMDELVFVNVDDIHKMTLAFDQKHMLFGALNSLCISFDNGELLASFDEEGNALPYGVQRSKAHEEGILHGASHVYIYKYVNGKLCVLLQRRSAGKDSYPGCLDMTSGGHMEFGCDFTDTALREIEEELGIKVNEEELTELFSQTVDHRAEFRGKPFIDREFNCVYAVKKDISPESLTLQEAEVAETVWKEADEILSELEKKNPEYCMDRGEFERVVKAILTKDAE